MRIYKRKAAGLACVMIAVFLVTPPAAQVEDQLSSYTGVNAEGYLTPLSDAIGSTLNTGYFRSAFLPTSGFQIGFEILVMGLHFSNADRVFGATTEGSFRPTQTVEAPTVVGTGDAHVIPGVNGTSYAFPGGFDLNSFGMLAPQLRLSSVYGTELVLRFARVNTGDAELGDIMLWGLGGRHNISQYMGEDFAVDMSAGLIFQQISAGENKQGKDLMETNTFSLGVNASKRFPVGFTTFEPYTALSYDTYATKVSYESEISGPTSIDFDRVNTAHWTVGFNYNLLYVNLFAEYHISHMNSFGFGFTVGSLGYE
jgi:hypothetical protein